MRLILISLFCLSFFSCTKPKSTEIVYSLRMMTKVDGVAAGNVNQLIPLTVSWFYTSGSCDILDKFEETRQGNIISIKAYGYYSGSICTADAGITTKIYNFISTTTGTFELRFINPDNSFITYTITIN